MNIKCKNPNCKKTFPSGYSFPNGKNITLSGNTSVCPYCGFLNGLPNGVFNFENGKPILVKTLSSLSKPSIIQLHTLIKKTTEQNLGLEEFKEEMAMISPTIFDFITPHTQIKASFLIVLAFILSVIIQLYPEIQEKISQNVSPLSKKEIKKSSRKQKSKKSIEKESFSLSESKREANLAKRKFFEEQRKKKH